MARSRPETEVYNGGPRSSGGRPWAGDSGAPVFSYPDTAYNIVAYGLLKGGEPTSGPCVGTTCTFTYMPIDRVNDTTPFNICTTQGLRTP